MAQAQPVFGLDSILFYAAYLLCVCMPPCVCVCVGMPNICSNCVCECATIWATSSVDLIFKALNILIKLPSLSLQEN